MRRVGIIDIGSNSIKFFVGEKCVDGTIKTIVDKNDIARLGEGLRETGRISDEALERNAKSVAAFAAEAKENGVDKIVSVGTMALRSAANSGDFTERLSYLAILSGMPVPDGDLVIFDTGGGSTEFIFGRGKELKNRFSVNLGAIRITEKFFSDDPVREGSVEAALKEIGEEFGAAGVAGHPVKLVGMGGTVTSMGAVKHKMVRYNPDIIQGSILTRADIAEQIEAYRERTIEQRREIPGLQPKRAEVILAGACILKDITERLGADQLTISDRGLRHGLAFDLFSK